MIDMAVCGASLVHAASLTSATTQDARAEQCPSPNMPACDFSSCHAACESITDPASVLSPCARSQNSSSATVEAAEEPAPPPRPKEPYSTRVKGFLIKNFLLVGMCIAVIIALSWPEPGCYVGSWKVGNVRMMQALNNAFVFFISGLTLKTSELRKILTYWKGFLYGTIAILVLTPCLGFGAKQLPLQPSEFAVGLAIFCVVPTTLGVGVALVSAAKGNQTLALLLTVVTNLLGIATVPYELQWILQGSETISVDPIDLLIKLVLTVLVPTVIGNLLSSFCKWVAAFVAKYKVQLSLFSTANLVFIAWQTLSGAREVLLRSPYTSVLIVIACVIVQHLGYLLVNWIVVFALRLPPREAVATVIMASQKSAPVAVTVITYISPDISQQGLFAIPGLCGQIIQIFIGSVLVRFLEKFVEKESQD